MSLEQRLLAALMRSRAVIILGLAAASGWTTWNGLALFMVWPIALILTAAVQTILVIATYQLSAMHVAASPRRYLAVAFGLMAAFSVSVFFSYFTFYAFNEGDRVNQRKFAESRRLIEQYISLVMDARSLFLKQQHAELERRRQAAQDALEGWQGNRRIDPGPGPIWRSRQQLAESLAAQLRQEVSEHELDEKAKAVLAAFNSMLDRRSLLDAAKHQQLRDRLVDFQTSAAAWLTVHGRDHIAAPPLPAADDFRTIRPSPADLSQFSLVAFCLAVLVDLFTVLLTWWLESVPFGNLPPHVVPSVLEALLSFNDYELNRGNQLEFSLRRTGEERHEGVKDGWRKLWAGLALNLGLLARVNRERVEFTPRLYHLFALQAGRQREAHDE
jgi:hypothetical protein